MEKVFFVEDNDAIREAVVSYLKLDDFQVFDFPHLKGVQEALLMQNPAILILDVMLPDGNGFHFARALRKKSDVPILFLTAKDSETDRITGFEVGGDDYLVKPFSPKELVLRVKAILKRTGVEKNSIQEEESWDFKGDRLDLHRDSHRIFMNKKEVILTGAEWKILDYLASCGDVVVSRERLLGEGLDYLAEGSERTIDTHVKNIRSKLGNPLWIATVRGFGYRFSGEKV